MNLNDLKKIHLEDFSKLPKKPSEPGYIIYKLVEKNIQYLKEQKYEAGLFAINFKLLADKGEAAKDRAAVEDELRPTPIVPIYLGDHEPLMLQAVINGVMAVYESNYYLVVSAIAEQYLLIQMRIIEETDIEKFESLEAGFQHDPSLCDEMDCEICEQMEELAKDAFDDIKKTHDSFKEEFEEISNKTEDTEMMTDERIQEIKDELGTDEIPIVDEDDDLID